MKRILLLALSLLLLMPVARAQEESGFLQVSGRVFDASTGKPLHYASVSLAGTDVANVTNSEGLFTLKADARTPDFALVAISHIGYAAVTLKISDFEGYTVDKPLKISLIPVSLTLDPAIIRAGDPLELIRTALYKVKDNYPTEHVGMTAFYREMVKKGSKYLTMNEAVLDIDKAPYGSFRNDKAGIYKGRGSQNYDSTDTLFIKYQGGVVSILQIDQAKNPFAMVNIQDIGKYYDFSLEPSTFLGSRLYYVVRFEQRLDNDEDLILMRGRVFIDGESLAIGRMEMQMNVEGREDAVQMFVLKRPQDTRFEVESADYVVNYKLSGDKWYYDYARVEVKFKTRKRRSLFTNHYTVMSEIAVTDHREVPVVIEQDARIRFRDQMTVKLSAFTDPNFWENYNIIEPDTDIEAVIRKIVRQLKKHSSEENRP